MTRRRVIELSARARAIGDALPHWVSLPEPAMLHVGHLTASLTLEGFGLEEVAPPVAAWAATFGQAVKLNSCYVSTVARLGGLDVDVLGGIRADEARELTWQLDLPSSPIVLTPEDLLRVLGLDAWGAA